MRFRADLQGLRGVAISAVLLFHAFQDVSPNGYLGVDAFFVLSGFLVAQMLLGEEGARRVSLSSSFSFYFRRFKRIAPLYFLYCLVAAFLIIITEKEQLRCGLIALIYGTNIDALLEKSSFIEHIRGEDFFTHTWSLGVEAQFYLLAPALFAAHAAATRHLTRHAAAFVLLTAVSSALVHFVAAPPVVAFHLVFARLWQFVAAVLFVPALSGIGDVIADGGESRGMSNDAINILSGSFKVRPNGCKKEANEPSLDRGRHFLKPEVILLAQALLVLLLALFMPIQLPETATRVVVTLATAQLIAYGSDESLLSCRLLTALGDLSYSLYLFHWPVFLVVVRGREELLSARLLAVLLSLLLSAGLHLLFERPYRSWPPRPVLLLSLAFFSFSAALFLSAPCTSLWLRTLNVGQF